MAELLRIAGAVMLSTRGFQEITPDMQAEAWEVAIKRLSKKCDWVVLDPDFREEGRYEDEGRTWHQRWEDAAAKVYAIRDDYGSPEFLSENLGRTVTTQYLLTFMLAEEY